MKFVFRFFEFTANIQDKIAKIHEFQLSFFDKEKNKNRRRIFYLIVFILPFFSFILYINIKNNFLLYAFILCLMLFNFNWLFLDIKKPLVSVRSFCSKNILSVFLISLFAGLFIGLKVHNDLTLVLIIYAIFFFLWLLLSLIANAKVSVFVNTMISTGLTILSIIVNFASDIINLILTEINNNPVMIDEINKTISYVISVLKIILAPLLLISTFTTLACAAKKYWIDKYNNGEDIE